MVFLIHMFFRKYIHLVFSLGILLCRLFLSKLPSVVSKYPFTLVSQSYCNKELQTGWLITETFFHASGSFGDPCPMPLSQLSWWLLQSLVFCGLQTPISALSWFIPLISASLVTWYVLPLFLFSVLRGHQSLDKGPP